MNHDIIEVGDCSVRCRCGRSFVASSLEQAKRDAEFHFGAEMARSALAAGGTLALHAQDDTDLAEGAVLQEGIGVPSDRA